MADTTDDGGHQDQEQKKLGNGDGTLEHEMESADMEEFSRLLAKVSTDVLWNVLMTQQQRIFATALWQAANYGGRPKPQDLKHMEKKRVYAEWVLRINHQEQWKKAKKQGKLVEPQSTEHGSC
jgi:hypothetical protein